MITGVEGGPTQDVAQEPEPEAEVQADCCACGESKPAKKTMELQCSHVYCHDCIIDLFDFSLHKDSTLFPPRCCKETIPLYLNMDSLEGCHSTLTPDLLAAVEAKKVEYETANATFCSETKCGKLVPDKNISGGIATCSLCTMETCTTCKGKSHEGLYPEDDDTNLFMVTAGKVKWQQCSNCKNMVELDVGCFHIV